MSRMIRASEEPRKSKKYQTELLLELQNKGIIEIINKRFLIFPYHRTSLINKDLREHLISEIREVIFGFR